jgi:hypothetical protein
MLEMLRNEIMPHIELMLDRRAALNLARELVRTKTHHRGIGNPPALYRALLVDAGPSAELDELIHRADNNDHLDAKFLEWAPSRLAYGPRWESMTEASSPADDHT